MSRRKSFSLSHHASVPRSLRKTQHKLSREKVLKMLAVMERQQQVSQQPASDNPSECNMSNQEFFSTGRTGRRNALPDILGEHAHVTSSDLPAKLQALTTSESGSQSSSSSSSQHDQSQPGTSSGSCNS